MLSFLAWTAIRFRDHNTRRVEQAKEAEREAFRKRIARGFHDEAGNKITKIALITEIARRHAGQDAPLQEYLRKIEQNVQELRSGMRDFIWVLDPGHDNLYDTLCRLHDFANSAFENIFRKGL